MAKIVNVANGANDTGMFATNGQYCQQRVKDVPYIRRPSKLKELEIVETLAALRFAIATLL